MRNFLRDRIYSGFKDRSLSFTTIFDILLNFEYCTWMTNVQESATNFRDIQNSINWRKKGYKVKWRLDREFNHKRKFLRREVSLWFAVCCYIMQKHFKIKWTILKVGDFKLWNKPKFIIPRFIFQKFETELMIKLKFN